VLVMVSTSADDSATQARTLARKLQIGKLR
jgi:hypothetical protein